MAGEPEYEAWSQEQLITRIQELERQIGSRDNITTTIPSQSIPASSTSSPAPFQDLQSESIPYRKPPKAPPKPFDISKYSTRLIALKFAYLGQKYNGFEHHKNNSTPLPTIEEELWKALVKTRCINPIPTKEDATDYSRTEGKTFMTWDREGADVNWDGCEYSKCGRTDRGVSAFGQVIGVRVRSNLPKQSVGKAISEEDGQEDASLLRAGSEPGTPVNSFNDLTDELPYIQLLNRVLPSDIRVYAWCPNPPPNFSARFSCKERRYKYFFTNPCFAPVPGSAGIYNPLSSTPGQETMREGWLDISAMKQACKSLIGLHDFRNLCKIDASKQLTNFERRIFYADIEEVSPLAVPAFLSHSAVSPGTHEQQPKTYAFVLHGSAFLWHQVRSIMALLFLIGQRLEPPCLVDQLLDISANPTRPKYEMASDAPLVLWDCIFPDAHEVQSAEDRQHGYTDRLQWVYVGDEGGVEPKSKGTAKAGGPSSAGRGKWGRAGVIDDVWEVWRRNKIDETLSALLLDKIASHGQATLDSGEFESREGGAGTARGGPRVFDGGDVGKAKGNYVQVLERERQESVEVVNERYARRKGWGEEGRPRKTRDEDDGDE